MKIYLTLSFLFVATLAFTVGRFSAPTAPAPVLSHQEAPATPAKTLADQLQDIGITEQNISHIKFIGDEGSMTSGLEHVENLESEVEWAWRHYFQHTASYDHWTASGNRVCEVYTKQKNKPAATLYINATGRVTSDQFEGGYISIGLMDLAESFVNKSTAQN